MTPECMACIRPLNAVPTTGRLSGIDDLPSLLEDHLWPLGLKKGRGMLSIARCFPLRKGGWGSTPPLRAGAFGSGAEGFGGRYEEPLGGRRNAKTRTGAAMCSNELYSLNMHTTR